MAISKKLLGALLLLTAVTQIESRECLVGIGDCDGYCCGTLSICKDSCDGSICDDDDQCGNGCCRNSECGDCPLSKLVIGIIAGGGVVFLIIVIAVSVCCCQCCRSQPTVVVGRWNHLQNPPNMAATPSVNVVNTSSNVYAHYWNPFTKLGHFYLIYLDIYLTVLDCYTLFSHIIW